MGRVPKVLHLLKSFYYKNQIKPKKKWKINQTHNKEDKKGTLKIY